MLRCLVLEQRRRRLPSHSSTFPFSPHPYSDMWTFQIASSSWMYNPVANVATAVRPSPRYAQATTSIDPVSFAIYGGSSFLQLLGDLWMFSHRIHGGGWERLYPGPDGAVGTCPLFREREGGYEWFSCARPPLSLFARSRVSRLRCATLHRITDPQAPNAAFGAAAAYHSGQIYVVGGMGYDFVPGAQVYGFDMEKRTWTVRTRERRRC